jgi:predicted Zn-dependent protease
MGHEIAHAVARHSAERASTAILADIGTIALETLLGQKILGGKYIRQFGLDLPFNRSQELEADYLGLVFMSLAGYDIKESFKVWERMKETQGNNPAEFFSTHPSPDNRINQLKNWIPIVSAQYPAIG